MNTKRWIAMLLVCVVMSAASACPVTASEQPAAKYVLPITQIQIDRTRATVYAGTSFTLNTKVSPASRAHETVTWASSDAAVASVDQNGKVTAVAPGAASISATVGSGAQAHIAYCDVTVKAAPVKSFKLSNKSIALGVGDTFLLSAASFAPSYAYDKTLTWASQNERVASVHPDTGVVTAVAPGKTRVRAMSHNGRVQYCTVTVTDEVRARAVKITPTAKIMSKGQSFALTATVVPSTAVAEDHKITWETSNARVATVDENGVVTAVNVAGSCVITATSGNGRTATCKITVKIIRAKSVSLSDKSLTLSAGDTYQLTATILPANANHREDAYWLSDNPAVASVDGNGVVTAHKGGKATITIRTTDPNFKTATCKVTVRSDDVSTVTITATGDITIGGDPRKSAPASEKYYEQLYSLYSGGFLSNLRDTFSGSDEVTLVNLESNLTTTTQYNQKSYVLRARPAYADVLSRAGVEVVGHANNHAMDFGTAGARDTKSAVAGHGMKYVSGGTVAVSTVNGVTVGFCAFNATGGQVSTAMKNVVKRLNTQCDIVVVSLHWGTEFKYQATASQRNLAHAAVLAGADLVVGHHPHVVSGIEKYKGKYIVYSLGTLSSALLTPADMDTFVFQQTFKVDRVTGLTESDKVKLIPCSMSGDEQKNNARPVVMTGAARMRVLDKIKYYSRPFAETVPAACFE